MSFPASRMRTPCGSWPTRSWRRRLNRDQVTGAVRLKVGKKNVQPRAGRVTGKLDGVSFSFSFAAGDLTPETLLGAVEQIRTRLKELQKGDHKDVSALADLLRAS